MAVGIFIGIVFGDYTIPEVSLANVHPGGYSIFPYLFISIACGAISGFHATQAPMMARCLSNEKEGKSVFYMLSDEHVSQLINICLEHTKE